MYDTNDKIWTYIDIVLFANKMCSPFNTIIFHAKDLIIFNNNKWYLSFLTKDMLFFKIKPDNIYIYGANALPNHSITIKNDDNDILVE